MEKYEERLRQIENDHAVFKALFEPLVKAVEAIRDDISKMRTDTIKTTELQRLDDAVKAAHKRIDDYTTKNQRVFFEHDNCMKTRQAETASLEALRVDMRDVKKSLDELKTDDQDTSSWWHKRITNLVDLALPAVIIFIALLVYKDYDEQKNPRASQAELTELKKVLEDTKKKNDALEKILQSTPKPSSVH